MVKTMALEQSEDTLTHSGEDWAETKRQGMAAYLAKRHADVTKKLQQTELQLDDKAGAIFPRDNLVASDATFHRVLSELKQLAAGRALLTAHCMLCMLPLR